MSHEGIKVRLLAPNCVTSSKSRSSNFNYTIKAVKCVKYIKDKQKERGRKHKKAL
jgi:hypothetical protein